MIGDDDLVEAARAGRLDDVRRLLEDGAGADARGAGGATAVTAAAANEHVDVVRALVDAGADVDLQDDDRSNPLLLCGENGNVALLREVLRGDPDLGATNRYGGVALIPASDRGHVEMVRALLETDIDVDHVNRPRLDRAAGGRDPRRRRRGAPARSCGCCSMRAPIRRSPTTTASPRSRTPASAATGRWWRCWSGPREQGEQALGRALVALDREIAGAHGVGERAALPDDGAERVGIGVEDRDRVLGGPAVELDRPVGDRGAEGVVAEAQLVAALRSPAAPVSKNVPSAMITESVPTGASSGNVGECTAQVPSAITIGFSSRPHSVSS